MTKTRRRASAALLALASLTVGVSFSSAAHSSPVPAAVAGVEVAQPYAAPSPGVRTERRKPGSLAFTVAAIPDTQQEVFGNDTRMRNRSSWLVANRDRLKLRFVAQVGDLTNWGWLDPRQYAIAGAAMKQLGAAGIPYSVSVGNHDTRAVGWDGNGGYGGGGYAGNPECARRLGSQCRTELLVRRTDEFNAALKASDFGAVRGAWQSGKVDNSYSTFRAGNLDWLVLNLELWPRAAAVKWARGVVARHPRHNVIVQTHNFVDGNGRLSTSAQYGSTSPRYLWNRLVSRYPNIKMTMSGHTGRAGVTTMRGVRGNKVVNLLQTYHSNESNPVRLVRILPRGGAINTWVVSPNGQGSFGADSAKVGGLRFVR